MEVRDEAVSVKAASVKWLDYVTVAVFAQNHHNFDITNVLYTFSLNQTRQVHCDPYFRPRKYNCKSLGPANSINFNLLKTHENQFQWVPKHYL